MKIGKQGNTIGHYYLPNLVSPGDIAVNGQDIFIADTSEGVVYKIDGEGNIFSSIDPVDSEATTRDIKGLYHDGESLWISKSSTNFGEICKTDSEGGLSECAHSSYVSEDSIPAYVGGITAHGQEFWVVNTAASPAYIERYDSEWAQQSVFRTPGYSVKHIAHDGNHLWFANDEYIYKSDYRPADHLQGLGVSPKGSCPDLDRWIRLL